MSEPSEDLRKEPLGDGADAPQEAAEETPPKTETPEQTAPSGEEEEASSIFARPEDATSGRTKKTKPPKTHEAARRKQWRALIAGVLVVAILCGGYFGLTAVLSNSTDSSSSDVSSAPQVINASPADVVSLAVTTPSGSYTIVPDTGDSSATSSDTSSLTADDMSWKVAELPSNIVQNQANVASVVNDFTDLVATRVIADTDPDPSIYGFDKPLGTVVVTLTNDSYTVTVGNESPDESGYYIETTKGPQVYLATTTMESSLYPNMLSFVDTNLFTPPQATDANDNYFSNGTLVKYEKIEYSGTNNPSPITITPATDGGVMQNMAETTTPGSSGYGNDDTISKILSAISSGVSVDSVLAINPTPEQLQEYGLADPYSVVSVTVKGIDYKFTFGKPTAAATSSVSSDASDSDSSDDTSSATLGEGEYTLMYGDNPVVYSVNDANVAFADYTINDLYSTLFFLPSVTSISAVTVATPTGGSTRFDVLNTTTTSSDGTSSSTDTSVSVGGKSINVTDFKNWYQTVIGVTAVERDTSYPTLSTAPALTLTFEYTDSTKAPDVVTIIPYQARRDEYNLDGYVKGLIVPEWKTQVEQGVTDLLNGTAIAAP